MRYVELRKGSSWITFSKEACQIMGIKTASPILVFSVKGQENIIGFQIRRFDETGNMAVGFAMKPTRFSSKMAIRWVYRPEPEYIMHILGCEKTKEKFELKMKEMEYKSISYIGEQKLKLKKIVGGTLFYIGEWKI